MIGFKIIFFLGPLETLRYFVERIIKSAETMGIEYLIADTNDPDSYDLSKLSSFIDSDVPTVMFTMNQIGILLKESDENYWKKHNVPVIDFIQDHPRNYDDTLLNPPCDIWAISLDQNNAEFIKRFYTKIKDVFFLPNGGTRVGEFIPFCNRTIDVIYMGNCQPEINEFPMINGLPENGNLFYGETIEMMINDPMLTTEEAIDNWFSYKNISISEENILSLNLAAAPYIENFVRRYFKQLGMHALDKAGVNVEIFGSDSWLDPQNPFSENIHLNERIPSSQINQLINSARISLCYIPWYKRGCSEKNFDSMLNGALCVSDKSEYLDRHYVDGKNIVLFDLDSPEQMAADVRWLLDHPHDAEEIARNGFLTAEKYDTWEKRFERIACEYIPKIISHI